MTLPPGFTVRIRDDVQRSSDGSLLVGGSPLRAMRFAGPAAPLICGTELIVEDQLSAQVADRLLEANMAVPVIDALPPASADELTVVIPIHNRAAQLRRLLGSLDGLPVIVVDDASTEEEEIAAAAAAHGACVIRLDTNRGAAAARNVGLAAVTTPFVALVDSDIDASPSALLTLTRHFADPAVALVGPHVRARAVNARPRWFERYEQDHPALGLGTRPSLVRPGATVGWLPSACLVGRTADLRDGFDETLQVAEDVDLVWRLVAAGRRVRYEPSVEVWHDTRATISDWTARKAFYGTGAAQLATRHPGTLVNAVLSPATGAAALALLTRRPWAVPIALAAAANTHRSVRQALPATPDRARLATRITADGFGWALRQESSLLLRFWWPATALGCLVSKNVRRVTVSALAVDAVASVIEDRRNATVTSQAGRRLDDLAYGAGLWWGAWRAKSPTALAIRITRARRARS